MSAPRAAWKAIWYGANVDASTSARQSDTVAAIAALAGYTTLTTYTTKNDPDWDTVFAALEDVSGAVTSRGTAKRTFDITLHPYSYNASSDPDLDDKDAHLVLLMSNFLWLRIEANQTYPAAAGEAHPIEILSRSMSSSGGTHKVKLECRVRYPI